MVIAKCDGYDGTGLEGREEGWLRWRDCSRNIVVRVRMPMNRGQEVAGGGDYGAGCCKNGEVAETAGQRADGEGLSGRAGTVYGSELDRLRASEFGQGKYNFETEDTVEMCCEYYMLFQNDEFFDLANTCIRTVTQVI